MAARQSARYARLLMPVFCLVATSAFGQSHAEQNSSTLIELARARGQQMKVEAECKPPSLLALRIRHEMCPICRSIEGDFGAIQSFADANGILMVTIDLSSPETIRQSSLLIASLGLEELWPQDFSGLASVSIIDAASRQVIGSVQTDDVATIERALREAVDKSKAAQDASQTDSAPSQIPAEDLRPGPTQEMRELAWMVGEWSAVLTTVGPDGKEVTAGTMQSTISSDLDGCILMETMEFEAGSSGQLIRARNIRSYDRFRNVYRFIWLENMMGLADVFEGTQNDHGVIVTTNLRSDTSLPASVTTDEFTHTRVSLLKDSDDKFAISYESSTDEGKTWKNAGSIKYARKK